MLRILALLPIAFSLPAAAQAVECPKDVKSCKVLVLTPDEETALLTIVQNTGVSGPYNQIKGAVEFWVEKISKAPAGEVPKPDKK